MVDYTDSVYGSGKLTPTEIEVLVRQAVETLLWSEPNWERETNPEASEMMDGDYDFSDVAEESLIELRDELIVFVETNWEDYQIWENSFGTWAFAHDFILTRNGHGTGYWDRSYNVHSPVYAAGKRLTDNVKPYGTINAYVGDDGKVYFQ